MIEVYKMTSGKYDKNTRTPLKMKKDVTEHTSTRGHQYKLFAQRAKLETRKHSFGVRTVKTWNSLPADVVNVKKSGHLQNKIDNLLKTQDIVHDYKACLKNEKYTKRQNN